MKPETSTETPDVFQSFQNVCKYCARQKVNLSHPLLFVNKVGMTVNKHQHVFGANVTSCHVVVLG